MAYHTGALGTPTDYNFVSSFDMHKPDNDPDLALVHGKQTLYGLLKAVGNYKSTDSLEYNHWEQDWIMPKIKATGDGDIAGAFVDFTLDATSYVDVGTTPHSPYLGTAADVINPVRIGDLILIKPAAGSVNAGTYIRAQVTAKTTTTFRAYPIVTGEAIPAVAVADEIVIYSNAFGEGTGQPDGRATIPNKKTNNLQIIKNTLSVTGTEDKVVTWVKAPNGKNYWYAVEEENTQKVHDNHKELGMIIGKKITNLTLVNLANTNQNTTTATEGLIPSILSGGNTLNYSGITGITLADFETIVKTLDKERGSQKNWLKCGINLSIGIDNILGDRFKEGGFVYGNVTFDQAKKASLEWDTFSIGNYQFVKDTYAPFNDPQTFGSAGFGFPNEAMVIPMDTRVDGQGTTVPSLRVRYLEGRENIVTFANMLQIDGTDRLDFRYLSHVGLETFGLSRYYYIQK